MKPEDIKVGMCLTNDGTGSIPVYDSKDASGSPMLTIAPGSYIGQVCQIDNGVGGVVIAFTSEEINAAMTVLEKIEWYFLFKWIPKEVFAGAVRYSDLQANVSDKQIVEQVQAIADAEANGISFKNSIVKLAHGVADTVEAAIPWNLVILLGVGWFIFKDSGNNSTHKRISKSKTKWQKK
jgi:hypothetical protein